MYVIDPLKCYLIGGIALVASVTIRVHKQRKLKVWVPTIATVQNIRRTDDDDITAYVRFTDQKSQPQLAAVKVSDGNAVSLGASVEISYNPVKPDDAFVRSAKDMKLAFYVPFIAGLLIVGLGIFSQITLTRAGL